MPCIVYQNKNKFLTDEIIKKMGEMVLKEIKAPRAEVSVHLVGTKKMIQLNNNYRGIKKITDVLSFATESRVENDWGDIFICLPQIKKQAKEYGINLNEEFSRMLTHGILHLSGLDHLEKKESEIMFKKQEKIVKKIMKLC